VTLAVACDDPTFAGRLRQLASAWGGRTGGTVTVVTDAAKADVLVLPPRRLGAALAVPGTEFLPLPSALKGADNPLQRGRIAEAYREALPNWAGEAVGLPLLADGAVLVVRADRLADPAARAGFARQAGRPLIAPRTYEDEAAVGAYFREADGKPSLPTLPAAPGELATQFLRVVACYDRPAEGGRAATVALDLLADPATGEPRFGRPSFLAAAKWLASTAASRPAPGEAADPVVAVTNLRDLAKLPLDPATGAVAGRYAVHSLPGTRASFGPDGKPVAAAGEGNYVPFLGADTLIGVVKKSCANPAAAWDFLADGAGGAGSAATISDPTLGCGPFRREHVDEANEKLWLGYRFDPTQSQALSLAMRRFLALNVPNPATVCKLPDADERVATLEAILRRLGTGQVSPEAAMKEATAAWLAADAKVPEADRVKLRRNAAGLP
jgi:hypothetical protein